MSLEPDLMIRDLLASKTENQRLKALLQDERDQFESAMAVLDAKLELAIEDVKKLKKELETDSVDRSRIYSTYGPHARIKLSEEGVK